MIEITLRYIIKLAVDVAMTMK